MSLKKILVGLLKVGTLLGMIGGIFYVNKKTIKRVRQMYEQQKSYYSVAQRWLINKNDGKNISSYFQKKGIKTIAIYGMSSIGEIFYDEIKNKGVRVAYFIDKNAEELHCGLDDLPIVELGEIKEQEEVDAIIITPIFYFDEIVEDLESEGIDVEKLSLEDIVCEI